MSELRLNQRNRYRAFWELAHGAARVRSTPPSLQIAKNNLCNFKCVYCIDHRPGNTISRTRLDGAVWKGLLNLIPNSAELGFHGISEFFIDTEFFDILARCAAAGAALSLNTNGSVCTPRHVEALANYPGFLWITFSLDAASPETFLRIRGQDFTRILRNVMTYIDRFESRRANTGIFVSFVINRSSVKEMLPFLYLAKALRADTATYFRMHEYEGLDWAVEASHGGTFNYRQECVGSFAEEYNRELEKVRLAAAALGMNVDLPAPLPAAGLVEISG
jgi:MoaA/NifB/PqqE/SkfB family radical SAM enzyme